jgi:hypothetical protein
VQADEAPTPIVRLSQLAQVEELLARHEPSVVTISGPTGVGKSTFISAIAERAVATGWRVVRRRDEPWRPVLSAKAETTMLELASTIADDLEPSAATQMAGESARTAGGGEGQSSAGASAAAQFLPPIERATAALEGQSRPVAVLFDGYRPSYEVDHELASLFERLRSRGTPTIIVICDRKPEKTVLGSHADLELVLAPFDVDELRAYFCNMTVGVEPELSAEELTAYLDAASRRPELVDSLTRLFAFIATDPQSSLEAR